ncbi:DUF2339 domain-containing protein [Coraliomargarita akajimensis]|uniref:DUF2339 domain-containing protein n=1 Tax=Coraliomargarita akajimensis (strain DSM 45221 / IAM 15411 / JCM 23193 / KCTC 12865 / 04OKA010-24) TaxID=583355 RepID=D5EKA9_CORAD|nr:DUF2339 domain-containing protein [Coraliomargarita akajimensis]ADE54858.1 Protein of unknown function DUF2339, transmembrane [Coraliomargarita akajimensis DSM 45221]
MELLGILIVCFVLTVLVLPWVNMVKLMHRKEEIRVLRAELSRLHREMNLHRVPKSIPERVERDLQGASMDEDTEVEAETLVAAPPPLPLAAVEELAPEAGEMEAATVAEATSTAPLAATSDSGEGGELNGLAHNWFSRIVVWIGGVALLMAGFFMIKYSIESGWLTPAVRIWLTLGFGALLCGAGFIVSLKTTIRANGSVGQALTGAGVVCLYFAIYASVHMYQFIGTGTGFVGMVAVTVLAVLLSLRNGVPIAIMGLLGGFLTPLLMRAETPDTWLLFGYLLLLLGAAQVLCLRKQWWRLLLASLVGSYFWSGSLLIACLSGELADVDGVLAFICCICAGSVFLGFRVPDSSVETNARNSLIAYHCVAWVWGLTQVLAIVSLRGFALVDVLIFAVLAVSALVLAILREEDCHWLAWLGLIAVLFAAVLNEEPVTWAWLGLPVLLVLLFSTVAHWRGVAAATHVNGWRSLSMVGLCSLAPLLFLNRAFFAMETVLPESLWLWLSLGMAGLIVLAAEHLMRRGNRTAASVYYALGLALSCFGLWDYVPLMYHAEGLALLLIAVLALWKWRDLLYLKTVGSLLVLTWLGLIASSGVELTAYFFGERWDLYAYWGHRPLAWLLGTVGIGFFVYECWFSFSDGVRQWVSWGLGLFAVLVLTVIYRFVDQVLLDARYSSMVMETGLTVVFAVSALLVRMQAKRWRRASLGAFVLSAIVGLRIFVLHLTDSGAAGPAVFLNAVLYQIGLPFVLAVLFAYLSAKDGERSYRTSYQIGAMVLGFVWGSYLVQDSYGAAWLFDTRTTSSELYSYSVVWLLIALCYAAIGLLRKQKALQIGSLLLLILTVGKVFLIDAAELEGLFRVLSFLCLGLVLIGIGFVYNRFVFGGEFERHRAS